MKKGILFIGIIIAFLLSIAIPAFAQVKAGTSELGMHIGGIIGDDLMSTTVSNTTPELDSALAWGVNYTYNLGVNWGVEGRYTWHVSELHNAPASTDLNVYMFDVNAVYHFNPESQTVFYATGGIGLAIGDLDNAITGTIDGTAQTVGDDDGFTFNLGTGVKYYATENVIFRGDFRYRYIDKLVSSFEESLNTFEITAGVGYRF